MSRPQSMTRPETTYQPTVQRTSRKAIWSLVLSVIWIGGLGSLAGIALGASARREIPQTGERGRGLALAGIVVGIVTLIFAVGYWIFIAMHTGATSGGSGGGGGGGGY